jgi:hypothetical protein
LKKYLIFGNFALTAPTSGQPYISFIGSVEGVDIDELCLGDSRLPLDEMFDNFYDSEDQLFAFSKASTTAIRSPPLPPSP